MNDNLSAMPDSEPVRRRGDRRISEQAVPEDRRKTDRRSIPGLGALFQALFRRGPGAEN